jgi:hypothetical protein
LSAAATPPLSVPPVKCNSLLGHGAAKFDETHEEEEDDSEGEDFLVFHRRSLHLNRDDDAATVIAEGTTERDEMLEEEDVNDDDEFPVGDTTSITEGTNEVEEMQEKKEDSEEADARNASMSENDRFTRNSSTNMEGSRAALQVIQPLGNANVCSIPNHSPLRMSTQSDAKPMTPMAESYLEEYSSSDDDEQNLVEAVVVPSLPSPFRSVASVPEGTGTVPAHFGMSLISSAFYSCAPTSNFLELFQHTLEFSQPKRLP